MKDHLWPWIVSAVAMVFGAGSAGSQTGEKPDDEPKLPEFPAFLTPKEPIKPEKGDDEIRKLLKEKYNTAQEALKARYTEYRLGKDPRQGRSFDYLTNAAHTVLNAELDLAETPAARVAVFEKYLELAQEIEKVAKSRFDAGAIDPSTFAEARLIRIEAELQLARARKAAKTK